jgi:hypothetical protein
LLAAAAGCTTIGAQATTSVQEYKHDATTATSLALTAGAEDRLTVTGDDAATQVAASASFLVIGEPGEPAETALGGLALQMSVDGAGVMHAAFGGASYSEEAVLEKLDVTVPSRLGLELVDDEGSLAIAHAHGTVKADASESAVTLEDVGPVDVHASSIVATLDAGGKLDSDGGLTATLTGDDFDQLRFEGGSAETTVHVPPGRGWNLHFDGALTEVIINLGGATITPDGPDVVIGEGGPTLSFQVSDEDTTTIDDLPQ